MILDASVDVGMCKPCHVPAELRAKTARVVLHDFPVIKIIKFRNYHGHQHLEVLCACSMTCSVAYTQSTCSQSPKLPGPSAMNQST